jgi:hypothetical protein
MLVNKVTKFLKKYLPQALMMGGMAWGALNWHWHSQILENYSAKRFLLTPQIENISPDWKKLAFQHLSKKGLEFDIYNFEKDTLTPFPDPNVLRIHQWLESGEILYMRRNKDLALANLDGQTRFLTNKHKTRHYISESQDKIIFEKITDANQKIWIQDVKTLEEIIIHDGKKLTFTPSHISPDALHMVLQTSNGNTETTELCDLQSGERTTIEIADHDYKRIFSWSKDGTRVCYNERFNFYVAETNGITKKYDKLAYTKTDENIYALIGPLGEKAMLITNNYGRLGRGSIMEIDLANSEATFVGSVFGDITNLTFSPDHTQYCLQVEVKKLRKSNFNSSLNQQHLYLGQVGRKGLEHITSELDPGFSFLGKWKNSEILFSSIYGQLRPSGVDLFTYNTTEKKIDRQTSLGLEVSNYTFHMFLGGMAFLAGLNLLLVKDIGNTKKCTGRFSSNPHEDNKYHISDVLANHPYLPAIASYMVPASYFIKNMYTQNNDFFANFYKLAGVTGLLGSVTIPLLIHSLCEFATHYKSPKIENMLKSEYIDYKMSKSSEENQLEDNLTKQIEAMNYKGPIYDRLQARRCFERGETQQAMMHLRNGLRKFAEIEYTQGTVFNSHILQLGCALPSTLNILRKQVVDAADIQKIVLQGYDLAGMGYFKLSQKVFEKLGELGESSTDCTHEAARILFSEALIHQNLPERSFQVKEEALKSLLKKSDGSTNWDPLVDSRHEALEFSSEGIIQSTYVIKRSKDHLAIATDYENNQKLRTRFPENVPQVIGFSLASDDYSYLFLERAERGSLLDYIREEKRVDAYHAIKECVKLMANLHEFGSSNLKLHQTEKIDDYYTGRIEDLFFRQVEKYDERTIPDEVHKTILENFWVIDERLRAAKQGFYIDGNVRNWVLKHDQTMQAIDFEALDERAVQIDLVSLLEFGFAYLTRDEIQEMQEIYIAETSQDIDPTQFKLDYDFARIQRHLELIGYRSRDAHSQQDNPDQNTLEIEYKYHHFVTAKSSLDNILDNKSCSTEENKALHRLHSALSEITFS